MITGAKFTSFEIEAAHALHFGPFCLNSPRITSALNALHIIFDARFMMMAALFIDYIFVLIYFEQA